MDTETCWSCNGDGMRADGSDQPCGKCRGTGQLKVKTVAPIVKTGGTFVVVTSTRTTQILDLCSNGSGLREAIAATQ